MKRPQRYTRQIVVRVDQALQDDLDEKATANDRTVAQEVRFRLRRALRVSTAPGE